MKSTLASVTPHSSDTDEPKQPAATRQVDAVQVGASKPHLIPTLISLIVALLGDVAHGQALAPAISVPPTASKRAPTGRVGLMLDQRGADIVIKGFVPGSPAAAQKELHEGDRVVSINSQGGAAVSVRGMELAAVLALIRGPEGATVSISAVPPAEDDSHAKTVQLIRVSLDIVDSSLKPGEVAPELSNVTWIKGDPVPKFARDKVYIIECWATWCGPCVANIPHLDALHRKFQDQGLVVIGQNIWEEDAAKVRKFVEKMGDKMSFRVALDDYSAASAGERPADTMPKGAMSEAWIRPGRGGSYGIPQAFLVGKDGKVIWSGHPAKLTETMIETALNVAVKAQSE